MAIYTEIIGNTHSPEWQQRIASLPDVELIILDQWTAQKSRFLGKGDKGNEYPVALKRQSQVKDGDVILYDPEAGRAAVIKLDLNPVLVVDLSKLAAKDPDTIIRHAVELGHAIGNQHWPAVVKGTKVYVPLTVDKQVMLSVMQTHHIEDIDFAFQEGTEIIPYLAPHEIRRLFGGAGHESHSHADGQIVMPEGDGHSHVIYHDHGDGHVHAHTVGGEYDHHLHEHDHDHDHHHHD
jgi:urease accessory protein